MSGVSMKKNRPEAPDPADHEVDFSNGVRGKYAHHFSQPDLTVRIAPDVARVFPDADAVNEALRQVIRDRQGR
jgi:hypothetical protein